MTFPEYDRRRRRRVRGGHFPQHFWQKYFSGKGHHFFRQEVLNQYFLPEKIEDCLPRTRVLTFLLCGLWGSLNISKTPCPNKWPESGFIDKAYFVWPMKKSEKIEDSLPEKIPRARVFRFLCVWPMRKSWQLLGTPTKVFAPSSARWHFGRYMPLQHYKMHRSLRTVKQTHG